VKGIEGRIYKLNSRIHHAYRDGQTTRSECGVKIGRIYEGEREVGCYACLASPKHQIPEFGKTYFGHHPWPTLGQEREQEDS